ncbi:3169_t:CDS:2 [Scutellospora calospora]|uniref:3169_t:CDS:1 n=1 Tax=Scutellospora calospora TaxID=85575 RepID=A0ACA9K696_9GLOM|nr:3169_t:CDS:2 [Scutellospora calospora]
MAEINASSVQSEEASKEEFDEFATRRHKKYKTCETCKRYRTGSMIIKFKKFTKGDFVIPDSLEIEDE